VYIEETEKLSVFDDGI